MKSERRQIELPYNDK